MHGFTYKNMQKNLLSTFSGEDKMSEGIIEIRQSVSMADSDEVLCKIGEKWIQEAKPLHDSMKRLQDRNERYYLGDQLDDAKLDNYQARIVLNKVFQSLETVLPRATKKLPAPMVSLPADDDPAKNIDHAEYSNNLEEILLGIAQEQELSRLLKEFALYHQLYHLGVLKFGYDEDLKEIWIEVVRPQRLLIPPYNSLNYVIEYHEDTVDDLIKMFPDAKAKIALAVSDQKGDIDGGSRIGYYEITVPEFKFWKFGNVILGKKENPNYDFKNKKKNHWKEPLLDYIFSDLWTLGLSKYSSTTLVTQVITLQDSINKRKRQISDNADRANGTIVGYLNGKITKTELAKLETARKKPDGIVALENADPGSAQHFAGQVLPPQVFDDLLHTINEVDNIFGTHATIRGEKSPGEETFGGRQLLKESDQERIDEITRMLERVSERLYNAIAQLIRVHFDKDCFVTFLGADGASKQLKINSQIVKEGVRIRVKQGSTIVKDKVALSQEAIVLWQNKAIDPVTLYERIGDPTPFKTAERYYKWMQDPGSLFKSAQAEYDSAIKSDMQTKVLNSMTQADIENRSLVNGESVPPYQGATPQHIAVHQDFFQTQQFLQLPPEIRRNAAEHLRGEVEIVKSGMQEQRENMKNKPSARQMLDERIKTNV